MFHSLFGRIYGFTFFFRDLLTFRMLLQILFYTIVFYLKNNMNISLHSDKDLSMLRFTTSIGLNKNGGRSKYFGGPVYLKEFLLEAINLENCGGAMTQ